MLPHPLTASVVEITDGVARLWFTGGCFESPQRQTGLSVDHTKVELADRAAPGQGPARPVASSRPRPTTSSRTASARCGTPTPRRARPRSATPCGSSGAGTSSGSTAGSTTSPTPSSTGCGRAAPSTGPSSRRTAARLAEADTRPEAKKSIRRESLRQTGDLLTPGVAGVTPGRRPRSRRRGRGRAGPASRFVASVAIVTMISPFRWSGLGLGVVPLLDHQEAAGRRGRRHEVHVPAARHRPGQHDVAGEHRGELGLFPAAGHEGPGDYRELHIGHAGASRRSIFSSTDPCGKPSLTGPVSYRDLTPGGREHSPDRPTLFICPQCVDFGDRFSWRKNAWNGTKKTWFACI